MSMTFGVTLGLLAEREWNVFVALVSPVLTHSLHSMESWDALASVGMLARIEASGPVPELATEPEETMNEASSTTYLLVTVTGLHFQLLE